MIGIAVVDASGTICGDGAVASLVTFVGGICVVDDSDGDIDSATGNSTGKGKSVGLIGGDVVVVVAGV